MGFQIQESKIITYPKCKTFDNEKFRSDVLKNFDKNDFGNCKDSLFNLFNGHVRLRKKYVRANDAAFMTKHLHNKIMKRLRLHNIFLKKLKLTGKKCKTQRNFCNIIIAPFIYENFNSRIVLGELPNDLKYVDIVPVHRKKSKTNKTNYRSNKAYFQTFPS